MGEKKKGKKRKNAVSIEEKVVMFLQRARESSIAFIVLRKSMLEAVLFLIFNSFIIERLSLRARFLSLKKFFIHHLRISLRLHILFFITA